MLQSLSGGSGEPFRMTLTFICSRRGSSNMPKIIPCTDFSGPQDNEEPQPAPRRVDLGRSGAAS